MIDKFLAATDVIYAALILWLVWTDREEIPRFWAAMILLLVGDLLLNAWQVF